jgi:hypothetical protein
MHSSRVELVLISRLVGSESRSSRADQSSAIRKQRSASSISPAICCELTLAGRLLHSVSGRGVPPHCPAVNPLYSMGTINRLRRSSMRPESFASRTTCSVAGRTPWIYAVPVDQARRLALRRHTQWDDHALVDQWSWLRYAARASRSAGFKSTGCMPPLVMVLVGV